MAQSAKEKKAAQQHMERIQEIRDTMPEDDFLFNLADFYKLFGDSTRLRILYVLSQEELCVGDVADLLSMTQSAISHQLRVLKQSKLIRGRRSGKTVFYSLSDDHVTQIIRMGMEHIMED